MSYVPNKLIVNGKHECKWCHLIMQISCLATFSPAPVRNQSYLHSQLCLWNLWKLISCHFSHYTISHRFRVTILFTDVKVNTVKFSSNPRCGCESDKRGMALIELLNYQMVCYTAIIPTSVKKLLIYYLSPYEKYNGLGYSAFLNRFMKHANPFTCSGFLPVKMIRSCVFSFSFSFKGISTFLN